MNASVILPTYNSEKTIYESVKSVLNQTFKDFELFVIDDCSCDNTLEIIKKFNDSRIKIIQNEKNKGCAYSLNRGLENVKTRYIFRMDADDICHQDRFEKQINFIKDKNIAVCGTWAREFGKSNKIYNFDTDSEILKINLLFMNSFCHPSVLLDTYEIKKEDLFYSESTPHAEDYEFFSRISRYANLVNYPETLIMYRIHENQIKNNYKDLQLESAIKISQKNLEFFLENLKDYHKESSYAILNSVYGNKIDNFFQESISKTFKDLIEINKNKKIFDSEILIERKNYFMSLLDNISR